MNNQEILTKIGDNIRAERNRARLSQEGLAAKINMNVRNLGRIERGETNPKVTNIIAIMEALNIPFEALYKNNK